MFEIDHLQHTNVKYWHKILLQKRLQFLSSFQNFKNCTMHQKLILRPLLLKMISYQIAAFIDLNSFGWRQIQIIAIFFPFHHRLRMSFGWVALQDHIFVEYGICVHRLRSKLISHIWNIRKTQLINPLLVMVNSAERALPKSRRSPFHST